MRHARLLRYISVITYNFYQITSTRVGINIILSFYVFFYLVNLVLYKVKWQRFINHNKYKYTYILTEKWSDDKWSSYYESREVTITGLTVWDKTVNGIKPFFM